MRVYRPGGKFPVLSVTGRECALDCAHCGGRYLRRMLPAPPPETFPGFMEGLKDRGASGFLLSGGCDAHGAVPVEQYLHHLGYARDLGLLTNVHIGVPSRPTLEALCHAEPSAVSMEIVGSSAVFREVYGVVYQPEGCARALRKMGEVGLRAVPHITVGLRGGHASGEEHAISLLRDTGIRALIFNILIPTKGTRYENAQSVRSARVLELMSAARRALPGVDIVLGCMRPRGDLELETAVVNGAVDAVVNPSRRALSERQTERQETCCAIPFRST